MHCGPLRLIRNRDLPSKRPRLFENATPWWHWSCLSKASMVVQRIRTTSQNLTFVVWDISCYLWGLVHRYLFPRLNMSPWVHNFLVIPKKINTTWQASIFSLPLFWADNPGKIQDIWDNLFFLLRPSPRCRAGCMARHATLRELTLQMPQYLLLGVMDCPTIGAVYSFYTAVGLLPKSERYFLNRWKGLTKFAGCTSLAWCVTSNRIKRSFSLLRNRTPIPQYIISP